MSASYNPQENLEIILNKEAHAMQDLETLLLVYI